MFKYIYIYIILIHTLCPTSLKWKGAVHIWKPWSINVSHRPKGYQKRPRDCHRTPGYDVHSYSRRSSWCASLVPGNRHLVTCRSSCDPNKGAARAKEKDGDLCHILLVRDHFKRFQTLTLLVDFTPWNQELEATSRWCLRSSARVVRQKSANSKQSRCRLSRKVMQLYSQVWHISLFITSVCVRGQPTATHKKSYIQIPQNWI